MPAAGAADCLSLAFGNRLVGNSFDTSAVEIALSGAEFSFKSTALVACTGAAAQVHINERQYPQHKSVMVAIGDRITIGAARRGCRSYLAIHGGFNIEPILGSQSTYQPAEIGGFRGRALKDGDLVQLNASFLDQIATEETPSQFAGFVNNSAILRVTVGPEFEQLASRTQDNLFRNNWVVGQRMNRMGLVLDGQPLDTKSNQSMPSAAVFPGTIQCPPDGTPYLLGPDAQTTGGYPRIAQVIRADRHLIGQLKPGSKVRLVRTTNERATTIYREKLALLKPWLGDIQLW